MTTHVKSMIVTDAMIHLEIDKEKYFVKFDVEQGHMRISKLRSEIDGDFVQMRSFVLPENPEWSWLFKYMRECFANMGLKERK